MYSSSRSDKNEFLEQTKAAREERLKERTVFSSAIKIQATVRGFLCRRRLRREFLERFQLAIPDWKEDQDCPLIAAVDAFRHFQRFLFIFRRQSDQEPFERMCKYIICSMHREQPPELLAKLDYVTIAFDKKFTISWIYQIKRVLVECGLYLRQSRPEVLRHQASTMLHLNMLITFTACSSWPVFQRGGGNFKLLQNVMQRMCCNTLAYLQTNQLSDCLHELLMNSLCRSQVLLKKPALIAVLTLAVRPLIYADFNAEALNLFLLHILSVPALVHHTNLISKEGLALFSQHRLLDKLIEHLDQEQRLNAMFDRLEANYSLCVLGNLIQLSYLQLDYVKDNEQLYLRLNNVIKRTLQRCEKYVTTRHTNLTHWHPILGWFAQNLDQRLHDSLGQVKAQFQLFWSSQMVQLMFSHLIKYNESAEMPFKKELAGSTSGQRSLPSSNSSSGSSGYPNFLKKAIDFVKPNSGGIGGNGGDSASGNGGMRRYFSDSLVQICEICLTYTTALSTLSQLKLDILTGLCYHDLILPNLWKLIRNLSPKNGMNLFLDCLDANPQADSPEFQVLVLFCDCATHLITILDDKELYEEQKPFSIDELLAISAFLNQFIYRIIACKQLDIKSSTSFAQLFTSVHTLLLLLYRRDSRREFAPKDHWLIREMKISTFMKDLDSNKKYAGLLITKLPHVIPHKERVMLFRKHVSNKKAVLGLTESACASIQPTLITIHRSRILEDGYQQLNKLPPQALKGVIRVKFINEQGLDEAGIDQDGVFKEFLEETMKKMCNPSLNLFSLTSEQRLYPSPTSNLHENYLSLFEFVGKILGKAAYEGIVIDAPFASFFLNQLLPSPGSHAGPGLNQSNLLYSSIDQLPSLDPDLYKSLTYIKHYEGDVSELNLTFSLIEDRLGQLVTFELTPGGKTINVTRENRIAYIHLMAHFRMHKQIDEQCGAFVRGFRSIVSSDWLAMFSTPELQRLISGDNTPIDLADLRRNTRYYGGFHNSHRLINWFWDILQNEFSNEELGLLLKFVTSCSKPPLLGFTHLQPPFTIRCVEVGEDVDDGDTIGSLIRGFFAISSNLRIGTGRKSDSITRLPTSSTCFNLLKLPNYQKKSTLREKLRYAINSNTGFELS